MSSYATFDSFTTERFDPSGVTVRAHGELDIANAPVLRQCLTEEVDAGAQRMVVDLTGVTFMDSVALAVVLHFRRRLGDDRLAVVIQDDSYARLIFDISGIAQTLTLVPTVEAAVAATI